MPTPRSPLARLAHAPAAGLALVLLVALLARLLALWPFLELRTPQGDEVYYLATARSILAGEGHPGSYRAPLYPAFISLVFRLFGDDWRALQLAQLALSLVPVAAAQLIVRARFGPLAGVLSGLAVALMPAQAHYAHFFWSECLVSALLMLVFLCFDRYERAGRVGWLAATGLALGLTGLARETWILFALPAALGVALTEAAPARRRLGRAALFLACAFALVLPWTLRNQHLHGTFVLVSSNRWYPLAAGNLHLEARDGEDAEETPEERMRPHKQAARRLGELEAEAYWREVALEAIAAGQPGWLFTKLARNVPKLVSLRSQPIRYLRSGWLDPPPPPAGRLLVWYDALAYLALTAVGLAGLWCARGGRLQALAAGALLFTLALHVLANATARFLVPLLPLLVLYSGPLLTGAWCAAPRWRRVAGLATAVGFLWMAGSSWAAVERVLALF